MNQYPKEHFANVDWSRSNAVLVQELDVCYSTLLYWRHVFNPPGTPYRRAKNGRNPLVFLRMMADYDAIEKNVDWTLPNIAIAERLGVSRERARQLRVLHNKPAVNAWNEFHITRIRQQHLESKLLALDGDVKHLTQKELAAKLQTTTWKLRPLLLKHKIECRDGRYNPNGLPEMNFDLPNITLAEIWGRPDIAQLRQRGKLKGRCEKAKWRRTAGSLHPWTPDEYLAAVKQEVVLAVKAGRKKIVLWKPVQGRADARTN